MEIVPQKRCSVCQEEYPVIKQHWYSRKDAPDGFRAQCKNCLRAIKSYAPHKERFILQGRECIATHKQCSMCGLWFPLNKKGFYEDKRTRDGLQSACKTCTLAAQSDYYYANHDVIRAKVNAVRAFNREKYRRFGRIFYAGNRKKVKENSLKYYRHNRLSALQRVKNYRLRNPEKIREQNRIRKARIYNAPGTFTENEVLKLYEDQNGLCFHCKADLSVLGFHRDHWIPLSKGGTNWIENIRLLCPSCNMEKHDKLPHEWYPERYEKSDNYLQ